MAPRNDRIETVNRIFADALSLPPGKRLEFVDKACGGDPQAKDAVLVLLSRFDRLDDFLESPAIRAFHAQTTELQRGTLLAGRFRIVELVGRGGMGEVYRAQDLELNEPVALKIIRPEWREDPAMLIRFRDEIRLARAVSHPNVCNIHDMLTAEQDGRAIVFFTMEFLDGETLRALLNRRHRLPVAEVLEIAADLAAGLDAAHRQGIIHRDLKPDNIILVGGRHGRAVITDFGLAKPSEPAGGSVTRSGVIVGSAEYMAPEQFLGEPVTPAADIFALGVVVFEMTAGERPFPPEGLVRAAVRRLTSEPIALRSLMPGAPKRWDRALWRALSRRPAERQLTAEALIRELRAEARLLDAIPRPSRRLFLAAGGTGAIVALFWGVRRYQGKGQIDRPVVMMTPFTSATRSEDARALAVQIERGLQQSERVRLFDRQRIPAIWNRMSSARPLPAVMDAHTVREIALRGGVNFVLSGNLERGADEWALKLTLELMGNSPEHPQNSYSEHFYAATDDQLLQAGAKASDWIRRTAGEAAPAVAARNRPPQEVTTSSWEALREFTAGDEAWRDHSGNPNADPRAAAEVHLKRALEIDPNFPLAAARLADIQMASDEMADAMLNYERADEIINRRNLTDRESLRIAGLFALDSDRFTRAETVFSRYALEYPHDGLPLFYKAGAVDALGRTDEALHLYSQAIQREPEAYSYRLDRAIALLKAGRFQEADAECRQSARLNDNDWTDQVRGALAFARSDMRGVLSTLDRLRKSASVPFQTKSFLLTGCLRAEQGRWPEAEASVQEGLRFDVANGQPREARLGKLLALAQLYVLQARNAEAVDCCRTILSQAGDLRSVLDAGALLARASDVSGARKCLPSHAALQTKTFEWPGNRYRLFRLQSEIALAEGDARRAFALMKDTRTPNLWLQWPEGLVRAAVHAGEREIAAAELRNLFANPAAYWLFADISGPGFMREALQFAPRVGLASNASASLNRFLNQS
jgi:tetratricopeptide (TPR) repeat protein